MTPSIICQILALTAAGVIFWRSEPVINLMGPGCRVVVRLAFWFLLVGSAGLIVAISQGYVPGWPLVLILCGTAFLLIGERRIKGLVRLHSSTKPERRAVQ